MNFNIITADALVALKRIKDNTADLVITSPPYSDIINYGKEVSNKKPDDYADWFIPIMNEIYRVLKPEGSFILNINDFCKGGLKSTFVYDLISRNGKEGLLKLYDNYTWYKKSAIPTGGNKRFRNLTEYIFHFCKDPKKIKVNMERVLERAKDSSKERYKYNIQERQGKVKEGVRWKTKKYERRSIDEDGIRTYNSIEKIVPDMVRPDNVFRFPTASGSRDNLIKHPAPFHKELPSYFIKLLTDEGDLVIDPFSGIATTGIACKELNRNFIGIDLNSKYNEFAEARLNGEDFEAYVINEYDEGGNFIRTFSSVNKAAYPDGVQDDGGWAAKYLTKSIKHNKEKNGFIKHNGRYFKKEQSS